MSDQLLPVVQAQAKPNVLGAAAGNGPSAGSGGITNDFLILLLQMIPGGKAAVSARIPGAPCGPPTASDGGGSALTGKDSGSEEPAQDANSAVGAEATILQGMIAVRQQLLAMQVPPSPQGACPDVTPAGSGEATRQLPVPAANGELSVVTIATGSEKPASRASARGADAETAFVEIMKQMKPVSEPKASPPEQPAGLEQKDPAPTELREPSRTELPEPAREVQVQQPARQAANVEEAVLLDAVKDLVKPSPAKASSAGIAPVQRTLGQQVSPSRNNARATSSEKVNVAGGGENPAPVVREATRNAGHEKTPLVQSEPGMSGAVQEDRAKPTPVLPVSSAPTVARTDAGISEPVAATASRRQAVTSDKDGAGQEVRPDTTAEKSILPRSAAVDQPANGQNASDAFSNKTFGAALQQASGEHAGPVQQSGHSSMDHAQVLPPSTTQGVVDQMVKHISLQVDGKSSEMRMTLKPESLGEVVVQVRMDDGKMHAQIDVGQSAVKTALETNLPQLRQALVDRGIDVQRIDIFAATQSSTQESHGGQGDRSRRQGGNRRQADADSVDPYQASRQLGYNTIEIIM